MGVIFAFLVGYVLGARAGREGLQELIDSWDTITRSDEFRGLVSTTASLAGAAVREGLLPRSGERTDGVATLLADWVKDLLGRGLGRRAA